MAIDYFKGAFEIFIFGSCGVCVGGEGEGGGGVAA